MWNDKVFLYGGIIPMSKENLLARLREAEVESSSPAIPTVALKLWFSKGKLQNALPLDLIPTERPEEKVGFGTFPLLESIGNMTPKFPESDEIGEQLNRLLRGVNPTNNVNPARLRTLLQTTITTNPTGPISYEWPEFVRGQAEDVSRGTTATGLCLLFSSFPVRMSGEVVFFLSKSNW